MIFRRWAGALMLALVFAAVIGDATARRLHVAAHAARGPASAPSAASAASAASAGSAGFAGGPRRVAESHAASAASGAASYPAVALGSTAPPAGRPTVEQVVASANLATWCRRLTREIPGLAEPGCQDSGLAA
ncbi:MAG TPA: hypothetical protein VH328_14535, partial [Burkholderiaceae bacterium]|nr:hypothetical protein [Burkholderiaceae bacterium]